MSVGKLINLMSNDGSRYEFFMILSAQAVMGPLAIGIGVWLMYNRVGNAAFASFGTLVFLLSICSIGGYYVGKAREKVAKHADKRIKTLEETINSILVVKMYCWESFFLKKIIDSRKRFFSDRNIDQASLKNCVNSIYRISFSVDSEDFCPRNRTKTDNLIFLRKRETKYLNKRSVCLALAQTIIFFAPHIVTLVTFAVSIHYEDIRTFRASNVFSVFVLASVLSFYMRMMQGKG